MAAPEAQDSMHRIGSTYPLEGGGTSALGHKRTFRQVSAMSALPPKADMCSALAYVRFTPNNDIDCVFRHVRFGPILLQKSAMTGAWHLARTYFSSCLPSAR